MFNQTRPPLLPRFVAAVTVGALFSANIAPAFAADPAAPAKEKAAAPAKPEAKPAETKPAADAKAAPAPKADAKAADAKPADAKAAKPADAKAAAAKPADKPKPPDKKTKDAARKAYGEGEKAYAAGDFTAALAGFSKANELVPAPQAAYWAAKSIDGQGKVEDAIAAYEKLLADPDIAKLGDEKTNDAKQRVTDLKAKLVGEVNLVTTPIGATVSIDGTPQTGETPMIVKLPPGPHKLSLMAPGYEPKDVDIDVKGGEKAEQKLELTAKAPPPPPPPEPVVEAPAPPPPPPPPPPRSKVPAYITLGIAGAGAVVGTIFGIKALGAKNDFDKQPTGSAADDTERNALIADMAFGVAITLGVTGVVLLTSDDSTAPAAAAKLEKLPKRAKLVVAPYASPKGGGAGMQYTF